MFRGVMVVCEESSLFFLFVFLLVDFVVTFVCVVVELLRCGGVGCFFDCFLVRFFFLALRLLSVAHFCHLFLFCCCDQALDMWRLSRL